MSIWRALDKGVAWLEAGLLAGGMLFGSLLLFANVIGRYVFNHPIFWAEECVRFLMVWMIFVGAAHVILRGGHVAVDVMTRFLSGRANTWLGLAMNVVAILFCLLLGWYSLEQTLRVQGAGQVSPAMQMPMWLAYLAMPVGSVLMIIRFTQQLVGRIGLLRQPPIGEEEAGDIVGDAERTD